MDQNLLEYNLPVNAYATFDAVSLKELIKERLTENSLFTDQNFEGSNLAALADIFAFAYHILLFYYNQTASEALFDQAELYENMNKIVKAIGYKPSGPRTSVLGFTAEGTSDLPIGAYTIKRYSNTIINGATFSFAEDTSFDKTIAGNESLNTLSENALLYQGAYFEYPDYTAIGEDYETITMVLERGQNATAVEFIDYDNIDVYILESESQIWYEWEEVDSLYSQSPNARVYEKRVNENGRYEFKFGNNINGRRLNASDTVSIFYLLSNGITVGAGALRSGSNINIYNTTRFRALNNTLYSDNNTTFVGAANGSYITLNNTNKSTDTVDYETVESIKQNSPALFSAQNRAVTLSDYKAFLSSRFNNILQSSEVVNNDKYLSDYIKYYYDIGLSSPNENTNVLTSHFLFSDACDFNNIYIFAVPRNGAIIAETNPSIMAASQKQAIKAYLDTIKMASNEVVVIDPIYTAFDLGIEITTDSIRTVEEIRETATLNIRVDSTSRLARSKIKDIVNNIFVNYFKTASCTLGQNINISDLSREILDIETVIEISTNYTLGSRSYQVPGISMVYWNPLYPQDDLNITNQTVKLPFFKFPFLYEASKFINKINITD
jgi:hypothetical protein